MEARTGIDHDPVNSPSHYTFGGIECIDAIEAMLGPIGASAFRKGNAVKYIWRAGHKGPYVEDLEKAKWYLQREIDKATVPSSFDIPEEGVGCPACNDLDDAVCSVCGRNDRPEDDRSEPDPCGRCGMYHSRNWCPGAAGAVYVDGKECPGFVLLSFDTAISPSVTDCFSDECCTPETASVGSPHEASTDRPHRPVDHDTERLSSLARMARQFLSSGIVVE